MSGHWAQVNLPDGSVRQDWVPADQPPSPDGSVGMWHVVEEAPGQPTRWEWHPTAQQPVATEAIDLTKPMELKAARESTPRRDRSDAPSAPDDQRAALLIGGIWGAFVALLPGVRTPVTATWDKVSEQGTSGSGLGFALLLALLVAVYVLGAVAIALGFARVMGRPPGRRTPAPKNAPRQPAQSGT